MEIHIISTPPGEAPEEIREAWVGLTLPAAVPGPQILQTFGVLSGPKTWLAWLRVRIFGGGEQATGYLVEAQRAVEILARRSPEAAEWWRMNAGHLVQPGQCFVFHAEVCQELADDPIRDSEGAADPCVQDDGANV